MLRNLQILYSAVQPVATISQNEHITFRITVEYYIVNTVKSNIYRKLLGNL